MRRTKTTWLLALAIGTWIPGAALAQDWVADFDHLPLASDSYWNGSGGSGGFYGDTGDEAWFANSYDAGFGFWDGFSYSNVNNTTTPDYTNQYAAFPGTDQSGSGNYAIGFDAAAVGFGNHPIITFSSPTPQIITSAYVANTTYAALTMRDGDSFAKRFGGTDGDDPDFLRLDVYGVTASGSTTADPVPVYLADYRFADNAEDYILDDWQHVDLTPLGEVVGLEFHLTTTDIGTYGPNTPMYFAIDNLTPAPEPTTAVLLLVAAVVALVPRRRRK